MLWHLLLVLLVLLWSCRFRLMGAVVVLACRLRASRAGRAVRLCCGRQQVCRFDNLLELVGILLVVLLGEVVLWGSTVLSGMVQGAQVMLQAVQHCCQGATRM